MTDPVHLGDNVTLYLADCLEVMRGMPDRSVDAVVTDPPYGELGYGWDKAQDWAKLAALWAVVCRPVCQIVTWGDSRTLYQTAQPALEAAGFTFRFEWITQKPIGRLWSYGRPIRLHEFVGVFRRGKETEIYSDMRAFGTQPESVVRVLVYQAYMRRHKDATGHPTQKDLAFVRPLVEALCPEGGTVLDPFMGSGTTGVACVQTGRNFIGIEIDPTYFAMAEKRIREAMMQPTLEGLS
jgi:site-specific DNA-methyltransferase (adenine-specific)